MDRRTERNHSYLPVKGADPDRQRRRTHAFTRGFDDTAKTIFLPRLRRGPPLPPAQGGPEPFPVAVGAARRLKESTGLTGEAPPPLTELASPAARSHWRGLFPAARSPHLSHPLLGPSFPFQSSALPKRFFRGRFPQLFSRNFPSRLFPQRARRPQARTRNYAAPSAGGPLDRTGADAHDGECPSRFPPGNCMSNLRWPGVGRRSDAPVVFRFFFRPESLFVPIGGAAGPAVTERANRFQRGAPPICSPGVRKPRPLSPTNCCRRPPAVRVPVRPLSRSPVNAGHEIDAPPENRTTLQLPEFFSNGPNRLLFINSSTSPVAQPLAPTPAAGERLCPVSSANCFSRPNRLPPPPCGDSKAPPLRRRDPPAFCRPCEQIKHPVVPLPWFFGWPLLRVAGPWLERSPPDWSHPADSGDGSPPPPALSTFLSRSSSVDWKRRAGPSAAQRARARGRFEGGFFLLVPISPAVDIVEPWFAGEAFGSDPVNVGARRPRAAQREPGVPDVHRKPSPSPALAAARCRWARHVVEPNPPRAWSAEKYGSTRRAPVFAPLSFAGKALFFFPVPRPGAASPGGGAVPARRNWRG